MARTVLPSCAARVLMRRYIVSGMSKVVLMARIISYPLRRTNMDLLIYGGFRAQFSGRGRREFAAVHARGDPKGQTRESRGLSPRAHRPSPQPSARSRAGLL